MLENRVTQLEKNLKAVADQQRRILDAIAELGKVNRGILDLTKQEGLFTYLGTITDLLSFVAVRALKPEELKEFLQRFKEAPSAVIPKRLREFLDKLQGEGV